MLRSGFRLRAQTPVNRLKFESTGGSRSYGLSAGWLIVSQQGRVQLPLAPPQMVMLRAWYSGWVPQPSKLMTRVQFSLLAPCGSRLVAKTRRCQRRERGFEFRLPLQVCESGVAKTVRHLPAKQIIGSAILPATSRVLRWCSSVGRARAS